MVQRRMLTIIGGQVQELPPNDTFIGSPASNGEFRNATFTADGENNKTYVISAEANVAVALPAAPLAGLTHTFRMVAKVGVSTITIFGAGNLIDGVASKTIYAVGDVVELLSDGTDWHSVSSIIKSHVCVLSATTIQSIPTSTSTVLAFQVEDFTSLPGMRAGSGVNILRAGMYMVSLTFRLPLDLGTLVEIQIRVNGTAFKLGVNSAAVTGDYFNVFTAAMYLNASDVVTGAVWHNNLGARSTITANAVSRPVLSVAEIR